jgi:hypothetical protein
METEGVTENSENKKKINAFYQTLMEKGKKNTKDGVPG